MHLSGASRPPPPEGPSESREEGGPTPPKRKYLRVKGA